MKKAFLFLFLFSLILFAASAMFFKETFLHVIALHLAIFSISLYFLFEKDFETTFKKLGITGINLKEILLYTVKGTIGVIFLTIILSLALNYLHLNDREKVVEVANMLPPYILIFAIVFAPITEELFFRAFLVDRFGVSVSSIIFALSHIAYGSISEILAAFFIGYIFALIYKSSKSVLPTIFIHFLFNLGSIVLMRTFG